MQFTVERLALPGWRVLRVGGDLDMATTDQLVDAVRTELAQLAASTGARRGQTSPRLVVDLGPTSFIDSTGARGLVRAARATHGTGVELSIACPPTNARVRWVLDMLQLQTLVPVSDALPVDLAPGS